VFVSINTFCPLRESKTDVRIRLSRGSGEVHTGQRQPIVGTPIEVPEPSTVNCRVLVCKTSCDRLNCDVLAGMFRKLGCTAIVNGGGLARLGFRRLCGLRGPTPD